MVLEWTGRHAPPSVIQFAGGQPLSSTLYILMNRHAEQLKVLLPLWYAEMAWAKELLVRAFELEQAEHILEPKNRGRRRVPGTNWYICTHGIGVDVYQAPDVGGIDFDFDKPHPDEWRLRIFFEKQINAGNLSYAEYQELADDEQLLKSAISELLASVHV
jgi:hypothetical protein